MNETRITISINLEELPLVPKHGQYRIYVEMDKGPEMLVAAFPLHYNEQGDVDKDESRCEALKNANWMAVAHILNSIHESKQRDSVP